MIGGLTLRFVKILQPVFRIPTRSVSAMSLLKNESYINGQWVTAKSGKTFPVVNPSNGKEIGQMSDLDASDAKVAVDAAFEAFQTWKKTTAKARAALLLKWYELMTKNADELAQILTMENGKPVAESKGEALYAASFLEWYAGEGRRTYGEVVDFPIPDKRAVVTKEPLGVAGIIIPWNFPFAMLTRKTGAALAAGCTVVVKTPEDTPYSPTALAELAMQAGIPKGVVNVLSCSRGNTAGVGQLFCDDKKVATVSFTGSTEVGRILMAQCAPQVKRVSLELGGLAPFIVFDSADLGKVRKAATFSKFRNAGQACISSQNFFLQEGIYDDAVAVLKELTESVVVGDGCTPGVTIGPLINERGIAKVDMLVQDAVSKGAKVVVGGGRDAEKGPLFYKPTLLTNIDDSMKIVSNEVFGPVLVVHKFKTEEEVIRRANNTDRGLASYFFTSDLAQTYRVMEALETGLVGVNDGMLSSCETPFGGYKQSGIGRESGHQGMDEFLQVKATVITL